MHNLQHENLSLKKNHTCDVSIVPGGANSRTNAVNSKLCPFSCSNSITPTVSILIPTCSTFFPDTCKMPAIVSVAVYTCKFPIDFFSVPGTNSISTSAALPNENKLYIYTSTHIYKYPCLFPPHACI